VVDSEDLKAWYSNTAVKFEIVKAGRFKEMRVSGDFEIRWLTCFSLKQYDEIVRFCSLMKTPANIYRSLEDYDRINSMSFNLKLRKDQYVEWDKVRVSHISGTDFAIDLDDENKNFMNVINDVDKIKATLDKYEVIYSMWMSGNRGFHFLIPFHALPKWLQCMNYLERMNFFSDFADKSMMSIKSLDMSVYTSTRVFKYPFTISKSGNVILPLYDEEYLLLRDGKLSLKPLDVLKERIIKNRGVFFRGNVEGTHKFFDELGIGEIK
jgi:hypothetical protein